MNKFWAKVRFKDEKNAEWLIKAFFQDFNPESSIVIRGKEARLEILFQEPPMAIIKAINHCDVVELNCGKNLKEYEEGETTHVETEIDSKSEFANGKSFEQKNAESESTKQIKQPKKEKNKHVTRKKETTTNRVNKKLEIVSIPELEEIAKKATSFESFVNLVAEWLDFGKRQKFFVKLAIISTKVDNLSWKELENELKDEGVDYKSWDRISISNHISERLKAYSVTFLPFLNSIVQYKNYSFKDVTSKTGVKMECMPEIKDFEKTLAKVDGIKSLEDRVYYVLNAMRLSELPSKEQEQLVEFAMIVVKKKIIDFDTIFVDSNIPDEQIMEVRMRFSKFVNDFVQRYDSDKKVKLKTFFSELQKVIISEDEIENPKDLTD